MNFQDKMALITGGGTGIGRSAAESLVALGAKVVINGRREDILTQAQSQIDASGKKVTAVAGDIAKIYL
jgi:NAD(P)-dependent dehydrogenase (short-subunit alcohol dehydrogenase family)